MPEAEKKTAEKDALMQWKSQLDEFLSEMRKQTVLFTLLGFLGVVVLLMTLTGSIRSTGQAAYIATVSLAMAILIGLVSRFSYLASALLVVACSLGAILYFCFFIHFDYAIFLLFLPVGLATLALSRVAGFLVAAAVTAGLLLVPGVDRLVQLQLRAVSLTGVWMVYGMLWLMLKPLLTTMEFAWNGYVSSRNLLEEARDYQLKLSRTLEDLADANVQLTRLNKQAHAMRLLAEEERTTKERFVANVSHELRTPLHMIIGFCEMITHSPEMYGNDIPASLLADLTVVLRNSQHLQSLIDDVLDLSQIEAGRMALTRERVKMIEILHASMAAVRPLFESKGLYLRTEVPEDLPMIYCDRTRIREVILNLLTNAGRFTQVGGVTVKAWQDKSMIVVAVCDTGPGIPKKDQVRLFQPFQQTDQTIRQRFGGTGLGLSISRNFIEMHDGKLWVESVEGQGSTFTFQIPIEPPIPVEAQAAARMVSGWEFLQRTHTYQAPVAIANPRLVIVDKGEALQHLLKRYQDTFELVPVNDFAAALEENSHNPAQAILVNESEDKISSLLERAYNSSSLPYNLPVLLCSLPEITDSSSQLGANHYLVKPVTYEQINAAIAEIKPDYKTVLVVDDELDALRLISRILTQAESTCRVLRASNGVEALEVLHQEPVDLVLLDLMMPDMDGYQLLQIMNANSSLKDIPRIILSARDPFSQHISSRALSITCRGGLAATQLLTCINSLKSVLLPSDPSTGRAFAAEPLD